MRQTTLHLIAMAALVSLVSIGAAAAQTVTIYQATLAEPNQSTQEVNTEQVRRIVADGSAMLVDSRSRAEYAAGHIPGARVLNGPESAHVAELEHLVGGDKSRALVLYCDGPYAAKAND